MYTRPLKGQLCASDCYCSLNISHPEPTRKQQQGIPIFPFIFKEWYQVPPPFLALPQKPPQIIPPLVDHFLEKMFKYLTWCVHGV